MKSLLSVLLCVFLLCSVNATVNITVSGVSSGGAFAVQFHVAHSSMVNGAGIVAGIPYYCANGDVSIAQSACMKYPDLISVSELVQATKFAYASDTIDSPAILATSKVYLYSGTLDSVVNPGVVKKLQEYYSTFMPSDNILTEYSISSDHAMVTNFFGSNCSYLGEPYINNCNYDAAGTILNYLYGKLKAPIDPIPSNIISMAQAPFIPLHVPSDVAALGPNAYIYVPNGCKNSPGCQTHVVFHGCEQTIKNINTTFITDTGYNGWAEANNIVVLYPQAIATDVNPKGCWDWWGFTGEDYASKLGVQIATVKGMIDYVTQTY